MKQFLNRQKVEASLAEMWDALARVPDADPGKQQEVQRCMRIEEEQKAQLALQDKFIDKAWRVCNEMSPNDPLAILDQVQHILFYFVKFKCWCKKFVRGGIVPGDMLEINRDLEQSEVLINKMIVNQKQAPAEAA